MCATALIRYPLIRVLSNQFVTCHVFPKEYFKYCELLHTINVCVYLYCARMDTQGIWTIGQILQQIFDGLEYPLENGYIYTHCICTYHICTYTQHMSSSLHL